MTTDPQTAADAAERVQAFLDARASAAVSDVIATVIPDIGARSQRFPLTASDLNVLLAELEQARGERAPGIPETRYPGAWGELTGYVQEAVDDGGPINAADLLAYMAELQRNERAQTREWMRAVFGDAATTKKGPESP